MATYAKVLKDTSGNQILPYTRAKLVYMDNNVSVQTAISNIQNQGGYTLPTASSSTLGGVKIGNNINISSGTISLTKSNVINTLGYTPTSITVTDIGSNIKCMSWARIYEDTKIVKRIGNFIYFHFGITKSNSQSSDYSINPGIEYELSEFSLAIEIISNEIISIIFNSKHQLFLQIELEEAQLYVSAQIHLILSEA